MTKRGLILAIILFVIALPICVHAEDNTLTAQTTINGVTVNWTYELNESNEVVELKCENPEDLTGDITIPSTIDGKTVSAIGFEAFEKAENITGVTIPSTVKEIGSYAFNNCTKLSKVDLGSITTIWSNAFKNCESLTNVTIPNTVTETATGTYINRSVFEGCTNLTEITFEEGITNIPAWLCADTNITSIKIPDSVKTINKEAFSGCEKLTTVDLGNVTTIGNAAFVDCISLTKITIPNTLTTMTTDNAGSEYVFRGCTNLTEITFEEGITNIPAWLCADTNITTVKIPDSVKIINREAFSGCEKLTTVDLGNVTEIGYYAFSNCTSLESIVIPKTLTDTWTNNILWESVFTGSTNLVEITFENGITVIPAWICEDTAITEITIPNSVESIEGKAFANCENLKKITILDNVTNMGDNIFKNHHEDLTIYCYEGSTAAEYAIENEIKYVYLPRPIEDEEPEALTASVSYNPSSNTTGKVTAIIKANKELKALSGWTLSSDNKSLSKQYSENKTETVTITDIDGLQKKVTIDVDNIIKENASDKDTDKKTDTNKDSNKESTSKDKDKTTAPGVLPQTGLGRALMVAIIAIAGVSIVSLKKYREFREIK